ncbi:MAG: anaerobic sulfite reductase subunit AsrB [Sedimentisphaerales bacterium]|nr:anaerobic sulfite reductase subunit AsrB [Sedimentisphaerales bacterium]MBN2842704.1 anaerobic sulfite reductase subunit AsrB [Sedimentisphaerales bacterium]
MCNNHLKPRPYRLLSIKKESFTECTFRLECDHTPVIGQFYEVSLPRVGEMPISISGIGSGWLDMTIRAVGHVSTAVHTLKPGDNIFLRGPYGNGFPMAEMEGKHIIIAAGGCGVSPIRPIIEHFYNHPEKITAMDLLFGFKDPSLVLFNQDIDRWKEKFNTIITVDQSCSTWEGKNVGLITEYVKQVKIPDFQNMEVIIVGPPIMMKFTAQEFIKHGVASERIIVSMERRMSCGVGKCGHCKVGDKYVCLDGPVFRYDQAQLLID